MTLVLDVDFIESYHYSAGWSVTFSQPARAARIVRERAALNDRGPRWPFTPPHQTIHSLCQPLLSTSIIYVRTLHLLFSSRRGGRPVGRAGNSDGRWAE